ncbi:BCL2/adenovirus E1B 19 kDa protein-interacting protein 2-like isoform X1 [Corythoichthys intestinalis]|uniref:BCL2/adenovirus E1B 19 kDa protein-interacting protein 2-like isoform X1 n=1 Tax=Corythoichthys intestinalis TaxID=161448 RepID=UPI0025A4E575|nr:BCL2/adenovirus E1B 19 kDa protein-interacting protein 2-like isoform X1 [Corythoichthys intestinalis]XP_057684600.1 BCL2/adenovirus E1B 19 kDa protein-interacting protein 2-like isoform X1 [Corythoichthys intestinalis]
MAAVTTSRGPSEAPGHVTFSSSSLAASLDSRECSVATTSADADSAEEEENHTSEEEDNRLSCGFPSLEGSSNVAAERPVSLALAPCGQGGKKTRKILVAPALSVSLGRSESGDFHSAFLSPSLGDEDDAGPDFDLDAMETPSDSESLRFPVDGSDLEDDLQRRGSDAAAEAEPAGPSALEREDVVDGQGTRWRSFSTGPEQRDGRVNMSVLQPYLRVLSHGGYYGDGMNDIIVFSSCYLPENTSENYHYVMDNLFRYLVGTLDLMVRENYVIVYLCAGGHKDKLPGIGWLKECYHTIAWRLRKNLKGVFVVHPTWPIKALITIIKPFISSKFSRKLQFVSSLRDLSALLPTEHVQIPQCVATYDDNLPR